MMGKIRFSIIVPVYNVELYLKKCVDSLLCQDCVSGQTEILLIDDGSRDQSGIMCDSLSEQFPNIKVFHKENGGLSSARNTGIEKAAGEYIIFVDSDDYVEKNLCTALDRALEKYGEADAVFFDGIMDNGDNQDCIRRIPLEEECCTDDGRTYLMEHYKARNLNVEAWLYAYRRLFLIEHNLRFREGILHEDVEFTPRALLACGKIIELPDRLYHYMVRENSISTQKNKEKNIQDLFSTLEAQDRLARQQEPELAKWMKNAILDSYLNMVQETRMYQKRYRRFLDKRFLFGKAATGWNRLRVMICFINVRLYCFLNDYYKRLILEKT